MNGDSLDDVLIDLYKALLATDGRNEGGTRGPSKELLGVTLRIGNPRARLSRSEDRGKPFSAVGELLWYLSGSDRLDFIEPYIPRYRDDAVDGILPGAYGPRLFAMRGSINQIDNVSKLLIEKPGSRRAVIQLFDAEDIAIHKREIPCTSTLQFHLRNGVLHMSVTMRSNDAYWGLPHDVFCFTMIQEMMARRLGAELGEYIHHAGSMHVYDKVADAVHAYIDEAYQRPAVMPPMPLGDPFEMIPVLLEAERRVSHGKPVVAADLAASPYWADIIRLLQAFWARGRRQELDALKAEMANDLYKPYIDSRYPLRERNPRGFSNGEETA